MSTKHPTNPTTPFLSRPFARTGVALALAAAIAASSAQAMSPKAAGLVGSWLYGSLGTVSYLNPLTNEWRNGRGATEIVTINADGSYERSRLLSLTTYGCTSKLFITEKGTVKIEGDRLTYQPREGVNQGYTCSPSNGWRTTKINPDSYAFAFERDSAGKTVLVMRNGDAVAHYGRYER